MILPLLLKLSLAARIIQVLLASALKFVVAPLLAKQLGFYYFEAIILTTAGGIAGAMFFFYASTAVFRFLRYVYRKIRERMRAQNSVPVRVKTKKVFTRRNKFIVKLRGKYGMFGIIALTPPLFSIPLGSILANKYYNKNSKILLYLSISVALWSWIFTSVFYFAF